MTSSTTLIFSSIMATLLSGNAIADNSRAPGYLLETSGTVVRSGYNECWHTGHWTSEMSIAECDPYLVAKQVQAESMREEVPVPVQLATPEPEQAAAPMQPAASQNSESVAPVPLFVPTPTPQKVTQKRISFSAETLLEFNKFTLRAEGKLELDGLVQGLKGMDFDTVDVTGHSDRIGSTKYNQRLSEQRAYAVRDYLVSKNIPANKIVVAGKGETQPVTLASDCAGPKSKKLIACLQPDRRVDVEVTATKWWSQLVVEITASWFTKPIFTRSYEKWLGAGVGAVGGSILTGGSAVGTVGGAAVGGVIGHEIKK